MENIQTTYLLIAIAFACIGYLLWKVESSLIQIQISNEDFKEDIIKSLMIQNEIQQEVLECLQKLQPDVENIKQVTDLIEKYKIPNKTEQLAMDDMALDREVFDT